MRPRRKSSDSDSESDSPPRLVAWDSDSDSDSDFEEAPPRLVALDVEMLALQQTNMERQSRGAPHTHAAVPTRFHTHCPMLFGACAGKANEP